MRVCVRVFRVGFGPGLDSMSPARSRRSASHAAGTHGWLPKKTGWRGRWIQFAQCVPPPPDCGTPTTSRLYPFGACIYLKLCLKRLNQLTVKKSKMAAKIQDGRQSSRQSLSTSELVKFIFIKQNKKNKIMHFIT